MAPYQSDNQRKYFQYLESKGTMPKKPEDEFEGMDMDEGLGMIPDDGVDLEGEEVSSGEPHTNHYFEEEHPMYLENGDDEMKDTLRMAMGGRVGTPHPEMLDERHPKERLMARGGFARALKGRRGGY